MVVLVLTVVVGQEDTRSGKTLGASLGCPNDIIHVGTPTPMLQSEQKTTLDRRPSIGTLDGGPLK